MISCEGFTGSDRPNVWKTCLISSHHIVSSAGNNFNQRINTRIFTFSLWGYSIASILICRNLLWDWPFSSPVSIFWTDLTPLNMRKRWKHPAARVVDADFERNSLSLLYRPAQHLHSNSQFSQQPLTPHEPCFVILDRFDTLKHEQVSKTFRGANQRWRFWTLLSLPCAVFSHSNSQFSRQPPTPL